MAFWATPPRPCHRAVLKRLFEESKIRGMHAYGLATTGGFVRKYLTLPAILEDINGMDLPEGLIGHTRYSTSGDYLVEANNQPIRYGETLMVMNGVISMKPKAEYEIDYNHTFQTENDTEILAWQTEKMMEGRFDTEWRGFLAGSPQSIAAAWIRRGSVYVARNRRRPLWITSHQGAIFAASTNDILMRSGLPSGQPVPENQMYQLGATM